MTVAANIKFIGSVKDDWQLYSDHASDYSLGAPIGFGSSSIVYAASFKPSDSQPVPCALKVLDLDSLPPHSLSLLQRETILMSLSKHPNVIRVRGSWMVGHKLYIAMRLMNRGSAADIMRYGWPGGMEEDVVCCILKQALEGLNYLHINGFIHRDVKAANLLIDDDGTVLLGDLGVAADLSDNMDHFQQASSKATSIDPARRSVNFQPIVGKASLTRPKMGTRKSFVGTPCWMAPEVIQSHQYDSSADIWSFGITALELTQGRPPRSRESPQRVLLKTVQDAPPTLDRDAGHYRYSRVFKEIVESCLLKDPFKRPTAADLLSTPFFKSAKKKSYLISTILSDLPPLTQRQERRRQSTANTGSRTVDSWDFTTTMGGGTSGSGGSCHSHGQSQLLKSPSIYRDSPTGSFYRLSEDEERELTDCGAQGPEFGNGGKADGGAKYSTIVSWADTLDEQDRDNENETADTSDPPNSPCPDYDSKCTLANDQPIHNLPSLPLTSPSSLAVESPASPIPQPSVGSALAELDRKSVNTFTNPNHPAPVPILPRDIMSDAPMVVLSSPAASVPYPFPKQVSGVSIPEPLSLSIGPTPSLWQKITSRARLMSDIEKNKDREQEKEREKYGNGGKERDEKDSGMSVRSRFARKADAGKNAFVRTRTRSIGFIQTKS